MHLKFLRKIDQNYIAIFSMFIIWKALMLFALIIAFLAIPLYSLNYLGGGLNYYLSNYYIYPWSNFDGEHLTSIAYFGYQDLQQAFFPLYPKLMTIPMYLF